MRGAARGPRLFLIVMLLLALGIGMSTALFSVMDSVLLRPLPVERQDRLVVVWKGGGKDAAHVGELSYPEFEDWRRQSRAFAAMAALPTTVYGYELTFSGYGAPIELVRTPVTAAFFSVLGMRPVLGRGFEESDNHPGAEPTVVLAYSVWKNLLHGDRSAIGRVVSLGGRGYTVIGVMPPDFDFPAGAQIWTPLGEEARWLRRKASFLEVVGRLEPGVTVQQAKSDVAGAIAQVARRYPQYSEPGEFPVLTPLADYVFGAGKPAIVLLWAASLLLLAIACINVTAVLVARAVRKEREVAIRLALGATRAILFRQFVAEGLVLSLAGAAAGCVTARMLIALMIALAPPGLPAVAGIPRLASVHLSVLSLAFACLLGVAAALVFGFTPTLATLRRDVRDSLDEGGARTAGSRHGGLLRRSLLVAEATVTTLLLIAAGTVVHNFHNLRQVRLGFVPGNVLTAQIRLPGADAARRDAFFAQLLDRLQSHPQVSAAGAVLLRPFEGTVGWDAPYRIRGQDVDQARRNPVANLEVVTPGYFQAVGTPLVTGRSFTAGDNSANRRVVIVSESLARRAFGDARRAVGSELALGPADAPDRASDWLSIAGVVADAQYRSFGVTQGDLFLPYLQTNIPIRYLAVRTRIDPASFAPVLSADVAALDPALAVSKVRTLDDLVAGAGVGPRFVMLLFALFAAFAGVLAAVGVYGMVADSVAERRREIGIRIALGAVRGNVMLLLTRDELRSVLLGECLGAALSIGLARGYAHWLYGLRGTDVPSMAAAVAVLASVSLAAGVLPALRTTRAAVTHLLVE